MHSYRGFNHRLGHFRFAHRRIDAHGQREHGTDSMDFIRTLLHGKHSSFENEHKSMPKMMWKMMLGSLRKLFKLFVTFLPESNKTFRFRSRYITILHTWDIFVVNLHIQKGSAYLYFERGLKFTSAWRIRTKDFTYFPSPLAFHLAIRVVCLVSAQMFHINIRLCVLVLCVFW